MSRGESILPLKMLLFCYHGANTIIVSFLPLYLQSEGLSGTEIGWVMAIGPFAAIFSQPYWGYMSDKYQTVKKILMLCLIGMIISSFFFLQMSTLALLLPFAAAFFFFSSPVGALTDSLAQRRANQLGISFGSIRTWGSIGFAVSSLAVGELLDQIGIGYIIWPYITVALAAFLISTRIVDAKVTTKPIQLKDVGLLIRSKPYVIFLVLMMFITIAHRANDSFIGIYIASLGGTENMVGIAWFAGVASEAVIFATAGWWFRKYHPLIFILGAGILYVIRWYFYSVVENPVWIVSFQFLHGFTFGIFYITAFQYITRLIPNKVQATGHLVFAATFIGVSGIIGSLLGGLILEQLGGSALYLSMAILTAVGVVFILIYHILPFGKSKKIR
ncbi:MFS transporter [Gracilibacillus alcaliphilus]|uniref:MFS transporter n=1 Tax=Gracilibacillus alcaliphilus TaxID=1401441 RepID=UPI001956BED4|nr:MFS transporter [Gracilibacillus alcaliphilus]MBM7677084.1 PPP family 3-phenylpropionic acid transporter [Gracilibacillus alcaliphilus]